MLLTKIENSHIAATNLESYDRSTPGKLQVGDFGQQFGQPLLLPAHVVLVEWPHVHIVRAQKIAAICTSVKTLKDCREQPLMHKHRNTTERFFEVDFLVSII